MPRRTATSATPAPASVPVVLPKDLDQLAQSDPEWVANLRELRRQWKWAAFSQFFYTFAQLLTMSDVTLVDIEDDLAQGTTLYLPRLMQRLLYTLTQDRKITLDTWQSALRKQYLKRDPSANPLGPEPKHVSRESSREPSVPPPNTDDIEAAEATPPTNADPVDGAQKPETVDDEDKSGRDVGSDIQADQPEHDHSVKREVTLEPPQGQEEGESRDWLELPMLEKLDSLHLLTEWQFHNPLRLRSIMKSDDEWARWRIEPIGYDAKTNAYWLIGPDRLWIQRAPPKPPKGVKRKRPATHKSKAQASTSQAYEQMYESDSQAAPKRNRAQAVAIPRASRSRAQQRANAAAVDTPAGGRGTRAAKLQANKKLDVQAKELAEFQRQSAAERAGASRSPRSTRQTRSQPATQSSPTRSSQQRPVLGTRASARLRGAPKEEEEEWQQIPDDWLNETVESEVTPSHSRKDKGKQKQVEEEAEEEEEEGAKEDESGEEPANHAEDLKTGLESDGEGSELTELSDDTEGAVEENDATAEEPNTPAPKTGRQIRSRKAAAPKETEIKSVHHDTMKHETDHVDEPPTGDPAKVPEDFIEWEAICVTLCEWEHIAERFEKATHYLEKALYKMLIQHIVPGIVAELMEAERRQKMEEAVVHRKRSSRIAMKESEKEEARLAAKKKAEEDEKLARAKRLEARAKKEEAERAKRERAREQRRIEREEREERARAKQERDEKRAQAEEDRGSTATPAMTATHSTDSIQLSRVNTPSGVQTPNWILDCEICHKHGVNLDDGLPMVSCNSCSTWQHIPCHDYADQQAGRPRRDWKVHPFYCQKCRLRASNSGVYPTSTPHRYPPVQQQHLQPGRESLPFTPKGGPSYPRDIYSQNTSELRYMQPQTLPNGGGVPQDRYGRPGLPQNGYTRTQNGLTISHYQPEQRGFSRSVQPSYPVGQSSSPAWDNGYAAPTGSRGAGSPVQFVPQFSQHSAGSYDGGASSSSFQPIPQQHQPYGMASELAIPATPRQWGSSSNGYFPPNDSAVRTAAESLAFMQNTPSSQNGWHHNVGTSHSQSGGGNIFMDRNFPTPPRTEFSLNPPNSRPAYPYPP